MDIGLWQALRSPCLTQRDRLSPPLLVIPSSPTHFSQYLFVTFPEQKWEDESGLKALWSTSCHCALGSVSHSGVLGPFICLQSKTRQGIFTVQKEGRQNVLRNVKSFFLKKKSRTIVFHLTTTFGELSCANGMDCFLQRKKQTLNSYARAASSLVCENTLLPWQL